MFGHYGFYWLLLICSLQRTMGNRYREVWRFEPDDHIRGTYEKLQEVFQFYPVDRPRTDQGFDYFHTCKGLSNYNREVKHLTSGGEPRKVKPCRSLLQNCRSEPFLTDGPVRYCVSSDSSRRYDRLKQNLPDKTHQKELGRYNSSCKTEEKFFNHGLFRAYRPCACDCESSEQDVDRYFSLLDVTADSDKVVTGVRIRKDNHVFHIQIQQGTLGPNLSIIGEPQWKEIKGISTSDLLSTSVSQYHVKYLEDYGNKQYKSDDLLKFYKNNLVYAITYRQNTILLDDVEAGPGRVVTGLRFRQTDNDLRLEVRATPYIPQSGDIQPLASEWKHRPMDKKQRKPVTFESPDDPAWHLSGDKGKYTISSENKYVKFQSSDFHKDLGQTTVPYIDVQDVVAEPPSPLLGAGIIHKGHKDSAGFIALKGLYVPL